MHPAFEISASDILVDHYFEMYQSKYSNSPCNIQEEASAKTLPPCA